MPTRLDSDEAAAVMRSAGAEPLEPYRNSSHPWRCRCLACGREVTPRYCNIQKGSSPCKWCAAGGPDPAEAAAVMRSAGVEPLEVYPGSGHPWRCRCRACGREVTPRYSHIRKGRGPCKWCEFAGRWLDPAEAAAVMRSAGVEPLEVYPGSGHPWRCRCLACGREVTPRYSDIRKGQGPCKWCATGGLDLTAPALLYLVRSADGKVSKIGVTGIGTNRLTNHARQGLSDVVEVVEYPSGAEAQAVEQALLAPLRAEGIPPALSGESMPYGGWTETYWTADAPHLTLPAALAAA